MRRALVVLGVLIAAGLGWGSWQASRHGALHVDLHDVALKDERQLYGTLGAADVVFKDAEGAALASASAGPPLGVVSIRHPMVGDCRAEERAATLDRARMEAWSHCFGTQSRWFRTWVRRVRYADVKTGDCRVERTPVVLEESKDRWWLWWLPLPHVGGTPYTYFTLALWIDSRACRAAVSPRGP